MHIAFPVSENSEFISGNYSTHISSRYFQDYFKEIGREQSSCILMVFASSKDLSLWDAFRYSKNTIAYLIFFIKTRPHNSPKEKLYYRKFWVLLQGKMFSMWVYFTIHSTTTHLTVLGWTNILVNTQVLHLAL